MPQHATSGSWKPGQSGNPGGRIGVYARDLAREHTEVAIDTLVKALGSPRTCVQAAIALLDRGWGKPKETVEAQTHLLMGGIDKPPRPETLDEWMARRRRELAKQLSQDDEMEPPAGSAN